jgi:hypothetical protein
LLLLLVFVHRSAGIVRMLILVVVVVICALKHGDRSEVQIFVVVFFFVVVKFRDRLEVKFFVVVLSNYWPPCFLCFVARGSLGGKFL